jgi:predicted DNA-binding transcriptional regulator YafY
MKIIETMRLLQRMHLLIRRKVTGTPEELAEKLNISRASLFRYMKIMRALGASIQFCMIRQSYFYSENFELNLESLTF